MPNSVKHSETAVDNALGVGNMHIGAGGDKGPTSTTGFYNGINPPSGGYTVYMNKASGGPSIVCPANDADLITFTENLSGESMADVNACFTYFVGQSDKMVMHNPINGLITDSLVLALNASSILSYPRTGTSWKDLSGNANNGTLVNSPTFDSNSNFHLNDGGSNEERIDIPKPSQLATDQYMTIQVLFKLNTLPTAQYGDNSPILGARIGSDYMILAYPEVNSKSHLGVSYDDSRYQSGHESVFETEAGRWVQFTHVGIPYESGGYQRGKLMYYINGVLDRDEFISGDSNGWAIPNPFYAGYDSRWGKYSDVNIATVKMYNKQLTAEEISANYYQGSIETGNLYYAVDAGNLVSYESGATTAYPLTGSINSTLANGVSFNSSNNGCWSFGSGENARNTYLKAGGNPGPFDLPGWDGYTICVWVKRTAFGTWTSGTTNYDGIWNYYWNHNLYFSGAHTGQNYIAGTGLSAYSIDMDRWYNVIMVHNNNSASNNHKVYIDGEIQQTSTISNPSYQSGDIRQFFIGNWDSSWSMVGEIGMLQIYDKTLTDSEVSQNYNAYVNRYN